MGEQYGSLVAVKGMLRPNESATFGADADARLTALRTAISLQLEERTGRVFGGIATPETRTVDGWSSASDVLYLPSPVRSVTSVEVTGDYAQTLTAYDVDTGLGAFQLWAVDHRGNAQALKWVNGYSWPLRSGRSHVEVTAVWADTADGDDAPDDLTYIANYLIAEHFKAEQASPAGFTGPDGATVPVRNPWSNELVKTTIAKYAVDRVLLAF